MILLWVIGYQLVGIVSILLMAPKARDRDHATDLDDAALWLLIHSWPLYLGLLIVGHIMALSLHLMSLGGTSHARSSYAKSESQSESSLTTTAAAGATNHAPEQRAGKPVSPEPIHGSTGTAA